MSSSLAGMFSGAIEAVLAVDDVVKPVTVAIAPIGTAVEPIELALCNLLGNPHGCVPALAVRYASKAWTVKPTCPGAQVEQRASASDRSFGGLGGSEKMTLSWR